MSEAEDIFGQSLAFLGEDVPSQDPNIYFGPLIIRPAEKEGKANTLLADHLFSPALVLAELIEANHIDLTQKTVVELGAGTALPSLFASTLPSSRGPTLVVVTDHPDRSIIDPLRQNVETNRPTYAKGLAVICEPYEWGMDVSRLLDICSSIPPPSSGYDVVIMSDLLHFDASRAELLSSLTRLLVKSSVARAYVAAGTYTPPHICDAFLREGEYLGLEWAEGHIEAEQGWTGKMEVRGPGLDLEGLKRRKEMVRFWVGKWSDSAMNLQ